MDWWNAVCGRLLFGGGCIDVCIGVDVCVDGIGVCGRQVLIGGGCTGELGMCIGEIVDASCWESFRFSVV